MARPIDTDLYHNFRFHVVGTDGHLDPEAGFRSASVPDLSVDMVEYREGVYKYSRKYPGIAKVGDCSLSKGVVRKDSDFLLWIFKCINGGEKYRSDLTINEYHIADEWGINGHASKVIELKEAFPTSVKPTGDKDATSSEVAIQEITLAVEEIEVRLVPAA